METTRTHLLASALVVAAIISACSDGGGDTPPASGTSSGTSPEGGAGSSSGGTTASSGDGSTSSSGSSSSTTTSSTTSSGSTASSTSTSTSSSTSSSGGGSTGARCAGLAAKCGGGGNKDCCASAAVPGGTFNRSDDPAYPATLSAFTLDVYEITVGRFRAFVNAGMGTQASPPAAGAGAHPKIAGSGWSSAFNGQLATNTAALKTALACRSDYPAWSDAPGANENKPINCITWFEAAAFCAWDGGRLPTEAEWNYAAAGGSEQRTYPFGANIDIAKANYDCRGDGSAAGACAFSDILVVGSKSPAGDGRWGHADLAGNIWEWTLDYSATPYRLTTCNDCADLKAATNRTFRGGGFPNESFYETTATRLEDVPTDRDYDVGARCAR